MRRSKLAPLGEEGDHDVGRTRGPARLTVTPCGRPSITPGGAPMSASVEPSAIPSFFASGVPLYPAMLPRG